MMTMVTVVDGEKIVVKAFGGMSIIVGVIVVVTVAVTSSEVVQGGENPYKIQYAHYHTHPH